MNRCNVWVIICCFALSLLFTACGKAVPDGVIQPQQMELLLYDFHMAQAIAQDFVAKERYKQTLLYDYVFEKHSVTQADFDTSMVWYTRHPDYLVKIYSNVDSRLRAASKLIDVADQKPNALMLSGDTVNLWVNPKSYCLSTAPYSNKFTFVLPSDTTFYEEDLFIWSLCAKHISTDSIPTIATMELSVHYENDSIGSIHRELFEGTNQLKLYTHSDVKELRGQIYFRPDTLTDRVSYLWLSDVQLMRYHTLPDSLRAKRVKRYDDDEAKPVRSTGGAIIVDDNKGVFSATTPPMNEPPVAPPEEEEEIIKPDVEEAPASVSQPQRNRSQERRNQVQKKNGNPKTAQPAPSNNKPKQQPKKSGTTTKKQRDVGTNKGETTQKSGGTQKKSGTTSKQTQKKTTSTKQ